MDSSQAFTANRGFDSVLICADTTSADPVELAGTIARGRALAERSGKRVRFSLTTNGTLLDPPAIALLAAGGVSATISIDGPPEVHDAIRVRPDGSGSYREAVERARPLLAARPTPARVTLTRRCLDVERIVDHLLAEGFCEAGVTPAATLDPALRLDGSDMERLASRLEDAARRYEAAALSGRPWPFSNVTNLLVQFRDGASRGYPCGGGAGLLAAAATGELYACHRSVGDPRFALGHVRSGIDRRRQAGFLAAVHVSRKSECRGCWLRGLCGGGCHFQGALDRGRIDAPPVEWCGLIRRWYEACLRVYLTLREERPGFLDSIAGEPGSGRTAGDGSPDRGPDLNPLAD